MPECFYRTGQYERAWRAFEQYVKLRPDDWGMLNNYAYYLAERGVQLEKAEQMSRRTVEAEPDNANSLDTYAWILHLLGRDAEALPYMEKAVRLDPKSDTLRQHLDTIKKTVGR
jgi:tetratricopeptide (TPR) repeat protein